MKINIIQFDPVMGGETTLTNALVAILKNVYEVRIIHPIHFSKRGKPQIGSNWGKVEGEEFLSYSGTAKACDEADFIFCVNAKHVKGSTKSDKRELAQADSDAFFGQFSGKNFIFYEHGFHTWRLYNYENLFSLLMKAGNTIRVLTNTKMAIDFYKTKNYDACLCRQPFNTDLYREVTKNGTSKINICFNSRYSSTKGPQLIIREFMPFFNKGYNFNLNMRGNISDPVSVWHNIDGVLLKDIVRADNEIVFKDFAVTLPEIYDQQDYCVYAGYLTREERGKIEYSILEAIYYDKPLIVHPDVFEHFKYEEYGITPEHLAKSFIKLTSENLEKILTGNFDPATYIKNARSILQDFLPEKIIERFAHCINSPASKGRKVQELF